MLAGSVLFWRAWRRRRPEPDALTKVAAAGLPIALAFGCLALIRQSQGPAAIALLLGFHALNGLGYATMLPAALAFLTQCAPHGSRSTSSDCSTCSSPSPRSPPGSLGDGSI